MGLVGEFSRYYLNINLGYIRFFIVLEIVIRVFFVYNLGGFNLDGYFFLEVIV